MKYLVVSDIHGSSKGMDLLKEGVSKFKPDVILLLGDILYGAYDSSSSYVVKTFREMNIPIIAVRGNCDYEEDASTLGFDLLLNRSISIFGHNAHLSHKPFSFVSFPPGEILINGHTHFKCLYSELGVIHLNPGSIGLPRDECASFALIDETGISLINAENLETIKLLSF